MRSTTNNDSQSLIASAIFRQGCIDEGSVDKKTAINPIRSEHRNEPKIKYISSKPIGFQRHIWYLITNNLPTTFDLVFVFQRNRLCLLPWLINNGFSILFSFVVSISVLGILSSNSDNVGTVVLVFIILFVTMSKLTIFVLFVLFFSVQVHVMWTVKRKTKKFHTQLTFVFVLWKTHLDFYIYTWIAIYSLYNLIRRSQPNNEYTSLIEDSGATGNPIYTRA